MIRMTFYSLVGHFVAMLVLIALSWIQPITIKRPVKPRVSVRIVARTPAPPRKTPRVIRATPRPPKPKPKKKVIKRKKKPTPKPTRRRTRRRRTPKPTKRVTPRPTPRRTPRPRITPKRTPRPPRRTPRPQITPRPGEKVAFQRSTLSDYEYYLAAARRKIQSNFTVPRHLRAKGISCEMRFTVLRDGRIVNIQMVRSTGDPLLDGYARRALELTARLAPFPDEVRADHVVLTILFDYSFGQQ